MRGFGHPQAALFTGCDAKLQSMLDLAVTEFLDRLKQVEGFPEALWNAEREQQRRAGLRRLPSDGERRPTMD